MAELDASESLTIHNGGKGGGAAISGAILFDPAWLRQVGWEWFDPEHWGKHARPVHAGGRGRAWFVDAPFAAMVLRHYRRGGLAAKLSQERYLWQGRTRVRSFAEYRLTRVLHGRGLPVPRPVAAGYERYGVTYRAAILVERIDDAQTFADCVDQLGSDAPWGEAGRLIARFHHAGLDHADLNAKNILFDSQGRGWLIDFDRSRLRSRAGGWQQQNLARLLRSLHKLRGARSRKLVEQDFAYLYDAYEAAIGAVS